MAATVCTIRFARQHFLYPTKLPLISPTPKDFTQGHKSLNMEWMNWLAGRVRLKLGASIEILLCWFWTLRRDLHICREDCIKGFHSRHHGNFPVCKFFSQWFSYFRLLFAKTESFAEPRQQRSLWGQAMAFGHQVGRHEKHVKDITTQRISFPYFVIHSNPRWQFAWFDSHSSRVQCAPHSRARWSQWPMPPAWGVLNYTISFLWENQIRQTGVPHGSSKP